MFDQLSKPSPIKVASTANTKPVVKIEPQLNHLSIEQVKDAVPKSLRGNVSQALVDTLNALGDDPEEGKLIRDNFLSFSDILKNGNFKTQDYINAVVYVSYKICGRTNQEAYFLTFPERHAKLLAKGATNKDISAYVAAFNRGELVQQMLQKAMIPSWLLNQDIFQEAINTQVELMRNAKSERVKFMAADSLMSHLAKPAENVQTGVNINIGSYTGLDDLSAKIQELSIAQKKAIQLGVSTKDIASSRLVGKTEEITDAEIVEDEVPESNVEEQSSANTDEIARRLFG